MESENEPFYCIHCGDKHDAGEPGFRFPDRVFGLDVTPERREALCAASDEDTFEMDGLHFVRGVLMIPVRDRGTQFGLGLWAQRTADGWRIANQSYFTAPTLGVAADLEDRGEGWRPHIFVTDAEHPLAQMQRDGVDYATIVRWMSDEAHADEGRPDDEPFEARLATHGWELIPPAAMGRPSLELDTPPRENDTIKVSIRFLGTDANGAPAPITAGWWVRITDTSRPDRWGATLASIPRVPSTLMFGSPVWLRPEHVIEYTPAQ